MIRAFNSEGRKIRFSKIKVDLVKHGFPFGAAASGAITVDPRYQAVRKKLRTFTFLSLRLD